MNKALGAALGLVLLTGCTAPPQAAQPAPTGRWLAASGNVEVTMAPCGESTCGAVSRVIANNSMEHPGPASSPPATIGLRVLSGLRPDGDGWTGHIFNRENGHTYDCHLTLAGPDRLVLRGYVLLPLFGKTQIWRRVG